MRKLLLGLAIALAAYSVAFAQNPPFPSSLPSKSVVGNLGPVPAPGRAVSLSTLVANLPGLSGETTVADTAYSFPSSDATCQVRTLVYTSISTARTVTLNPAACYAPGTRILFLDRSGSASSTSTVSLAPTGSDLINGANATTLAINAAYGYAFIESDGASKWTIGLIPPATLTTLPWADLTGIPAGLDSGTIVAKTASFTVQTTDCNKTFTYNSTSVGTVTVAAGSNFPANCRFWLRNIGAYSGVGTARGLLLNSVSGASFPSQGFVLYPGQATEFSNVGSSSAWIETGFDWRKRWKPPSTVAFYADASSGSDTAADCLNTGAGACATVSNTYARIAQYVDLNVAATLNQNGSFGSGDVIHHAGPLVGGAGNAMLTIVGGTINGGSSACISLFQHATIEINGVTCASSASCLSLASGSWAGILGSDLICNLSGSTGVGVSVGDPGSKVEFINAGIQFGAATMIFPFTLNGGSIVFDTAVHITLNGNLTVTDTVSVSQQAALNFGSATWVLNAHTVTGTRYVCNYWSVIFGTSGAPNTFIPGNANGTTGSDCETP